MKEVILLRHFATPGNLEKRFNGKTDEPVVAELAKKWEVPPADEVYVTPLLRTKQTAQILYPDRRAVEVEDLREIDFGLFEGKNHRELNGDPRYQEWIDSGASIAFPEGEDPGDFRRRCADAFREVIEQSEAARSAFVVHGGTIMSILDAFSDPHQDYFKWMCDNGCGYRCVWTGERLEDICGIHF